MPTLPWPFRPLNPPRAERATKIVTRSPALLFITSKGFYTRVSHRSPKFSHSVVSPENVKSVPNYVTLEDLKHFCSRIFAHPLKIPLLFGTCYMCPYAIWPPSVLHHYIVLKMPLNRQCFVGVEVRRSPLMAKVSSSSLPGVCFFCLFFRDITWIFYLFISF